MLPIPPPQAIRDELYEAVTKSDYTLSIATVHALDSRRFLVTPEFTDQGDVFASSGLLA